MKRSNIEINKCLMIATDALAAICENDFDASAVICTVADMICMKNKELNRNNIKDIVINIFGSVSIGDSNGKN